MQTLHTTEQIFQLRYLVMPDYIYTDKRLTDVSRRVYSFIHTYKNPFFFGNDNLAAMFGCHEQTISTAMGQLEELGLIKVTYKIKAGGGKTRLCVDAHSERVSTLSRNKKSEATTERLHSDKDIKDNNLKEKNFLELSKLPEEEIIDYHRLTPSGKKENKPKSSFNGYRSYDKPETPKNPVKLTPLSYIQLWTIAEQKNVPLEFVKQKHETLLESIAYGNKYGVTSVEGTLLQWIGQSIEKGTVETLDWMGQDRLNNQHPERIAYLEKARKIARDRGQL